MGRKSREKRERREREKLRAEWGNDRPLTPPVVRYPPQPTGSTGSTHSERYLASLCRRTFLSTWSYPNVYRAERRPDGSIQSKEVCDLLVVFQNDVLLFSDKDIIFAQSNDVHTDWVRWYRRGVKKSAAQLDGAERIVRARKPLFLDAELKHPFPLPLPEPNAMRTCEGRHHPLQLQHQAARLAPPETRTSSVASVVRELHKRLERGSLPSDEGASQAQTDRNRLAGSGLFRVIES